MKTEEILAERGNKYGEYAENARVMQRIKDALRSGRSWDKAPDTVKEALECVALKLGRIVNGDPLYDDNYRDAIGYLTLALEDITARAARDSLEAAIQQPFAPHLTGGCLPGVVGGSLNGATPQDAAVRVFVEAMGYREVNPTEAGPPGTEPQDAGHAAEPNERKVPRADGIHLTPDHFGMYFRTVASVMGRLEVNDGPEPERFPFKLNGRRYTEYGFCAAADGDPIHDIIAFHPH
jgi:hypothetical protein